MNTMRILGLCVLFASVVTLSGCGLEEYEPKQQEPQAKLEYFDEENKLLSKLIDQPPKKEDLDTGSIFLRLPKGVNASGTAVADNNYLYKFSKPASANPHQPYNPAANKPGYVGDNFDAVYIAVAKDLKDKTFEDFKTEVMKAFPDMADAEKYDKKENINKMNNERKKSNKFEGYLRKPLPPPTPGQPPPGAPKPPPTYEGYFYNHNGYFVAIVFQLVEKKREEYKKQIELCLQSLAVGPDADKLRNSYVPRDPPAKKK